MTRKGAARAVGAWVAGTALAVPAAAQTDYYNTDAGRPLRVEDARPVERHAWEIALAPLRLERASGGEYAWEVEPEIAYGILPHTHVEVGVPFVVHDGADGERTGVAGLHLSALHALNVETRTWPALAVGASARLPVGGLAPDDAYATVTGIATRTSGWGRAHVNGGWTFGPEAADADDESRWMAALAVDRALPLRALLWTADVVAEQPLDADADLRWTAEAGFRYQVSPQTVVDGGAGRVLSGGDEGWYVTVGATYAFAVRALMGG